LNSLEPEICIWLPDRVETPWKSDYSENTAYYRSGKVKNCKQRLIIRYFLTRIEMAMRNTG